MTDAECFFCRAMRAERKLAMLDIWGDDDWMRRAASLAIDTQANKEHGRLMPLGFYQHPIPKPGVATLVVSRPQLVFRPEFLTVAPECSGGVLLDVRVGNRTQFVSPEPLPLSVFSPHCWSSIEVMAAATARFSFDTVGVAQDVVLTIDMTESSYDDTVAEARAVLGLPTPTAFKAILWGRTAEYDQDRVEIQPQPPPSVFASTTLALDLVRGTPAFAKLVKKIEREAHKRARRHYR